jgi:hypothetical protein
VELDRIRQSIHARGMAAWVIALAIGQKIGDRKIRDRNSIPYFSVPYLFVRWKTKVFNGRLAIHEKAEIAPFFVLFILRSSPLH